MQSSPTSIEIMAETYRRTLDADAQPTRTKVPALFGIAGSEEPGRL